MRRRASCMVGAAIAFTAGCVELPPAPHAPDESQADASLFVQDGGGRRPPAAEGPAAPGGCWVEPGGGGAGPATGLLGDGGALGVEGSRPAPAGASAAPRMPRAASEVVITELMPNPMLVSDTDGEWVELHNPSATTALDLAGCALDDGGASKPLADALLVPPGTFVTLARTEAAGFVPDRTLSFSLANEADSIALVCEGVTIDRVAYGPGFPLAAGTSMALDPSAFDATSNDAAATWCLSPRASYAEQGTPGMPNPPCHEDEDAGR